MGMFLIFRFGLGADVYIQSTPGGRVPRKVCREADIVAVDRVIDRFSDGQEFLRAWLEPVSCVDVVQHDVRIGGIQHGDADIPFDSPRAFCIRAQEIVRFGLEPDSCGRKALSFRFMATARKQE